MELIKKNSGIKIRKYYVIDNIYGELKPFSWRLKKSPKKYMY